MSLILNGTTGISDVDGTAAAPALTGTDTNTGIFFPAADQVAIATNGTQAMLVDSTQNATFAGTLATASRGIAAASMPVGSVIQVVQGVYSSAFSTTSTSYVSAFASATITPTSATSKILAQVSVTCGNGTAQWQYITIYRNNTTNLSTTGSTNPAGQINNNSSDYLTTLNIQILDSPATTSATTYTLYTRSTSGNNIRCQVDTMPSYVTLMEIAA